MEISQGMKLISKKNSERIKDLKLEALENIMNAKTDVIQNIKPENYVLNFDTMQKIEYDILKYLNQYIELKFIDNE